jgi:hypothetical protein
MGLTTNILQDEMVSVRKSGDFFGAHSEPFGSFRQLKTMG